MNKMSSLYHYIPNLVNRLLNARVSVKCKYCGQKASYKIQIPLSNPMVIANVGNNVPITETETVVLFNNITINESGYNPCNSCNQSPCCCPKSSSNRGCYEDSDSDSDCSCEKKCGGKKCGGRRYRKRRDHCGRQSSCSPCYPSPCGPYNYPPAPCGPCGLPQPYYSCPNPIAPNCCPNPVYPWCFYDVNSGTATVPRCGTGTYLITFSFSITSGPIAPNSVTGTIIISNGGSVSHTFTGFVAGETKSYHYVHRVHLIECVQFRITMIADLTGGGTATLVGNNSTLHIVKLY